MVTPTSVLVGAPGYAWKATNVDFGTGGEHLVITAHFESRNIESTSK